MPGFHVLGRETFVAGVRWTDGWPAFDEERYAVLVPDTSFVDDFCRGLHPRWVSPYSEPETITHLQESAGIVMPTTDGPLGLLCTRIRDHHWVAEAVVESAGRFCVRIDDRHWYGLHLEDGVVRAEVRIGDLRPELSYRRVGKRPLVLRIESVPIAIGPVPQGHGGPDDIVLTVIDENGSHELARIDGRYLSTEVATGFTGRMLALGSSSSEARIHSVSYTQSAPQLAD